MCLTSGKGHYWNYIQGRWPARTSQVYKVSQAKNLGLALMQRNGDVAAVDTVDGWYVQLKAITAGTYLCKPGECMFE